MHRGNHALRGRVTRRPLARDQVVHRRQTIGLTTPLLAKEGRLENRLLDARSVPYEDRPKKTQALLIIWQGGCSETGCLHARRGAE